VGRIGAGDGVVFCCRRGERQIQLTEAFTESDFPHFARPPLPGLEFAILTLYHEKFAHLPVAFLPSQIPQTLAEVVSRAGLRQLHTAESEKFAHVTFFFNGGSRHAWDGEQDICIPSRRGIPFEQIPELSLPQVAEQVMLGLEQGIDLVVANFANADVIGHTANNEAKLKCASVVDHHLGHVVHAALDRDYVVLITADHGNLESMANADGSAHVAHTANPVQLILIDPRAHSIEGLHDGSLSDVAPTILAALGLEQPQGMTGVGLAPAHEWGGRRRVLLVILDGWGIGKPDAANPIFLARTPVWDRLVCKYPHSQLLAAGEAVGLQAGKAGNSEAGHMNLGAGRLVLQDDVRLEQAMRMGTFQSNEVLVRLMQRVQREGSHLHLIGLLSEKSSHGSVEYPLALLRMAKQLGLPEAYLHIIFDGRSTQPGSAPALLQKLDARMAEIGLGQVVSGVGRAIALDREGNYAKTQRAFEAFVLGAGRPFAAD
jgi:2,3-bisphosphoglycerate-independent phosphoglycerate mutase